MVAEKKYSVGSAGTSNTQDTTATSLVLAPQRATGEPYTTSELVAAGTGINHRRVRDAIRKYQADLEAFGVLGAYQTKTPNNQEGGRNATGYILNEQQATFLLTLLKNTPVVVAFKKELVRQFYAMRSLLLERASPVWQDARSLGKEIRRQEIAAETGKPLEMVRRWESEALKQLRHPRISRPLRQYLPGRDYHG